MKDGRVACALAALVLATGCSSSGASPASDAGVHTAPESGADATDDGAADGSADGGLDATATGDGSTGSYVLIQQNANPAGTITDVTIHLDPHYASGFGCVPSTSGPCVLDDCSAVDAVDGGTLLVANAGIVSLAGGNAPAPVEIAYAANGMYRPTLIGAALFDAGAVLTVSAPGADFPAFHGESAPAPAAITVTAPAVTMGTYGPTYLFEAGAPLTWSWTGGSAGSSVTFSVESSSLFITCSFDAEGGTGTIPGDVVAQFPAMVSYVTIVSTSSSTFAAGTDTVLFQLESGGPTTYLAPQ
jgi:hypothetical protein